MKKLLPQFMLLLSLLPSAAALAQSDTDAQIQRLETELTAIRQEQQSVYQQFQMVQALRQSEMQNATAPPPAYGTDGQPLSFEETARAQQESQYRLQNYSKELQRLYARYQDLGAQSRQLLDQMTALARARQ